MASKVRKFKHTFTSTPLNSAPIQSAEIQTSLLQVGMRVRKSIGQGYRTEWTIEQEKLRSQRLFYKKQDTVTLVWEDKVERVENENGLDGFSSSQDSTTSTESDRSVLSSYNPIPLPRRKRSYNNEDEKGCNDEVMDAISTHLRPIAQATSRRKFVASKNPFLKGSENISKFTDFEDAMFLDPRNHCSIEIDRLDKLKQ